MKLREVDLKDSEVAIVVDDSGNKFAASNNNAAGGCCDCCKGDIDWEDKVILIRCAITGRQVWPEVGE